EDALPKFTTDEFSDTIDAVNEVAASGHPLAAQAIQALKDGRLLYSAAEKKVYIKTADDKVLDALTGQPLTAAPPDDADAVRLNNRVRNIVDAALGSLTLMAPDPGKRFDAAQSVFRSRDAAALPAIDKALAAEKDPRVKKALAEARAAIVLNQ